MKHATSVPPEVDSPAGGSPALFHAQLRQKLRAIGVVVEALPTVTTPGSSPPCFAKASYEAWLAQASVSHESIPYRLAMPAEPNYCRDCFKQFKDEMVSAGMCSFPDVSFEEVKSLGEDELIGVNRPPDVAAESYFVYSDLVRKRRTKCLTETSLPTSPPPLAALSSPPAARCGTSATSSE